MVRPLYFRLEPRRNPVLDGVLSHSLSVIISVLLLAGFAAGQASGPVARWNFDQSNGAKTKDSISGAEDNVIGYYAYAPGVSGNALRFDGYTTSVARDAKLVPAMGDAISVTAWVAPNTYPWNWVPVVDYQDEQQGGYFFGIDAEGHVGMSVEAGDRWHTVTSQATIPLKRWAFIAGTYDPSHGLSIYIDGQQVGHLDASGRLKAPTHALDLLIGRIRDPVLPYCYIHPKVTTWYSFDGLLDEVSIYNRPVSSDEIHNEGMGELHDDVVDLALTLRELNVESIPVNFLHPIDGTPLAGRRDLNPRDCLRVLCLFRLANPESEIRIAGGRDRKSVV